MPASHDLIFDGGDIALRLRDSEILRSLRGSTQAVVATCLAATAPMLVCCGHEQVIVYNDAAIPIVGSDHPSALGRPISSLEGERWRTLHKELVTMGTEPRRCDGLLWTPVFDGDEIAAVVGAPLPAEPRVLAPRDKDEERARVLVVEDDAIMRQHLMETLAQDFDVTGAEHGADALEQAVLDPPDLVITDVRMPELDGVELVRALRGTPRTSEVPVILVTAQSPEQARADELASGADDYIVKPFTSSELRERAHLQLALARIRGEEVRKASRAKDDFLAMVGHELRNPLSAVSTMLHALLLRNPTRELELMERALGQLSRLVEDLLESSRLSRGKPALTLVVIELARVIDSAVEQVGPLLQRHRVTVTVPRTGLRINADADRLARAIMNVLTNAAQHTPPERPIHIEAQREGDHIRLRIVDEGSGISSDRLGDVFQAFQSERREGGLGLGLSMARSIIELHHGSIVITSSGTGRGTECTIELPATEEAAPVVASPTHTRHRLLLVEDNDDAARALKLALEQLGYEVALAHDAPIAINLTKTFRPHVALLDLGLPVMDGWELARRLRDVERTLPIVAVTARDQDTDKQRSSELGFAEHLVKPIDLPRLKKLVDELSASRASEA